MLTNFGELGKTVTDRKPLVYVTGKPTGLPVSSDDLDLATRRIVNLGAPTAATNAATASYAVESENAVLASQVFG